MADSELDEIYRVCPVWGLRIEGRSGEISNAFKFSS